MSATHWNVDPAGLTVPLGSALLGMVLAVIALCATGVFGASLTHLTATPRLWGDPEQVSFDPANPPLIKSLEDNKAVTAITEGVGGGMIMVNKMIVGGIVGTAVRGPLLFSTVDGHPPAATTRSVWASRPCAWSAPISGRLSRSP